MGTLTLYADAEVCDTGEVEILHDATGRNSLDKYGKQFIKAGKNAHKWKYELSVKIANLY